MAKRKSPGEGSIRQMRNGRYRGELMLGYKADGSRNVFRCVGYTKEEVRAAFRKAHERNEKGQIVTSPRQTVADFLRNWLEDVAKPSVFARTYVGYRQLIENHAIPALGRQKLEHLAPAHIQRFYKAKLETHSPRTVHHLHACMHSAFETAVQWGLITFSPFDRVKPPKVTNTQKTALNPEEATRFYHAAASDREYGPFFILALLTGMREGELYALKWEDIDFDLLAIRVRRAYSQVHGVGRVLKGTKTDQPRVIPLLPIAVDHLRAHQHRQKELRLKAGAQWHDNGLVFTSEVGTPLAESTLRRHLHKLLDSAGLPRIRPYDLRHSAASIYLALGVGTKDVQALLGHSSIKTTLDVYGHSFASVQRQSMQRFNDLLSSNT